MRHELTHEKLQTKAGWIPVPERPGLGITLNEEFVMKHLVAESGRS
jgi:L-alanine-DL-glutamate epimerase-like enolase superfamily enzyme